MSTSTHTHHRITLLASAAMVLCFSAHAAGPSVDAGSLLRQTEQELKKPKTKPARKVTKPAPTQAPSPSETTVSVRSFKFAGNTLIESDKLSNALAAYVNRPLTLAQLNDAADVVTAIYRDAGWTVRTFLPKQEISTGIVTLQIVEAVFGGAFMQGKEPQRIEASRLVQMAEANLRKGQPLHADDLDRALLLLDDLPGVSVAGNLAQGQNDGETNLAISAIDDALVNGNATIDNYGARATGIERLSANLNINSPARMGDLLSTNLMKTQGTSYARASYSLPIGSNGWRAGVHASSLTYKVLTSYDQAASGTHGTAETAGLDGSYSLLRSQLNNVNLTWSYDDKKLENFAANVLNSNYKIKASSLGLNSSHIDNWGGGGSTTTYAALTQGRVDNAGSANAQTDADGARVAGTYSKLNAGLNRLQSITANLSFYAALSAQVASKNLDSSERMYLGGATGVRAFPASEAGGAAGRTLTLELRQRLDNALTLTGFYDYGHVNVNKHNANASNGSAINTVNAYALQGYGASLAWQNTKGTEIKATLAKRNASNPNADLTTGMDGDKTKKITRAWISAGFAF
jgi:hemolysin activation/secretion protein